MSTNFLLIKQNSPLINFQLKFIFMKRKVYKVEDGTGIPYWGKQFLQDFSSQN